ACKLEVWHRGGRQAYGSPAPIHTREETMHRVRLISVIVLAAFTASAAGATTLDLTSGTTGTDSQQSFYNLTRGADVTVLGATNYLLSSMTLHGMNYGTVGPGATLNARVYSTCGTLLASGSVPAPS